MYQSFKEMPTLLKFITAHALVCFIFFIAVVVPGIPIIFNGEVLGSKEMWEKGIGLPTVFVGLSLPTTGVLFLKRWQYSRLVYSALLLLVMVLPYIYWQDIISLLFGIVVSLSLIIYLYKNGKVRAYFNS